MDYQEYKRAINDTRTMGGQYWTNIVAIKLLQAADELGEDEANRLIRECHLEKDGWREED